MSPPSGIPLPTIAIFGCTQGTGLAILKLALSAGHQVNAMARNPSKLGELSAKYPNLHIIKGDIRDLPAVKQCLVYNKTLVDRIVSGVGMVMTRKGMGFTSSDPHICEDGVQHILKGLSAVEADPSVVKPAGEPRIVVISTTGISAKGRDIPVAMMPLYHWVLPLPHADKKKMEEALVASGRRFCAVRPSWLTDGESKGLDAVRTSTEGGSQDPKTAIGYAICRDDVALWLFEECVESGEHRWNRWERKAVTVTY